MINGSRVLPLCIITTFSPSGPATWVPLSPLRRQGQRGPEKGRSRSRDKRCAIQTCAWVLVLRLTLLFFGLVYFLKRPERFQTQFENRAIRCISLATTRLQTNISSVCQPQACVGRDQPAFSPRCETGAQARTGKGAGRVVTPGVAGGGNSQHREQPGRGLEVRVGVEGPRVMGLDRTSEGDRKRRADGTWQRRPRKDCDW